MSNTTMPIETPAVDEVVAVVPETEMDAPVVDAVVAEDEKPAKPKKGGYRVLALLSLAICAVLFFIPFNVFTKAWAIDSSDNLLAILPDLLKSNEKLFGFLPVLVGGSETVATVANLALYVLLLAIVLSAVLSLIAIFAGKRGLVCTSLFLITWGSLLYALTVYCVTAQVKDFTNPVWDIIVLAIGAVGVLFTFFTKLAKLGKSAWKWLLHVVLSLAVTVVTAMALMDGADMASTYGKAAMVISVLFLLNAILTFLRKKMGRVRAVLQFLLAAAILVLTLALGLKANKVYAIVATVVALLQLIVAWGKCKKRAKKEKKVAPVEEPAVPEFETVDYVEAYAYEGGPVAGVELAEEVMPTVAAIEAKKDYDAAAKATVASLLGNGFDPFLITLSEKEKEEFIDLYVLKCKCLMPEIPGYVVGGNNKDFFNKVFIYLGQYREKIPADLLEKMYKFSMKLS